MNDKIKEILKLASYLALTREEELVTEEGSYTTVDRDTLIRLDQALAQTFTDNSDDIRFEDVDEIVANINSLT